MTRHRDKPTITPERVSWFATYVKAYPAWGVFHVQLDDGNYKLPAEVHEVGHWHDVGALVDHVQWFNSLTPSQRKRLGAKAEALARSR